jgi:hypothetical protein
VLVFHDVTQRRRATNQLKESEARLRLLSGTAGRLLAAENPETVVNELCQAVMDHLDCQAFFNFLADESTGRLRLNACAGIPDEEVRKLEWLDYGVAVCGCVARDKQRMIAEDILNLQTAAPTWSDPTESKPTAAIRCWSRDSSSVPCRSGPGRGPTSARTMWRPCTQSPTRSPRPWSACRHKRPCVRPTSNCARPIERKNHFLAVLSHELRNPLAPIRNSLYILDRAAPGSDQARRAQMVIDRQVGHLSHLVDDLLDLTRISRNKIRLELSCWNSMIWYAGPSRTTACSSRKAKSKSRSDSLLSASA